MAITIQCPNADCGISHHVPNDLSGKRVKCRACGSTVTVPTIDPGLPTPVFPTATTPGERCRTVDLFPTVATPAGMAGGDHQIATPRSPTHSFAPQRIGRFEIIRRLGMGGFGAVFLAHDPQLDRQVALKIPRPGTLDDPEIRERFFREAKAAARLQHPHIVPVYDAGEDQGQSYIASAYIDGRTLADVLKERPVDPREAAEIVRKLAEALNYAHGQGIIHRDVKPANVMIDDKGEPHLMDFGLARLEQSAAQLTQDGTVMGTPAYMSPEQASGVGDRLSPASDQYSLGVVLYQLLTGRTPFDGPPQVVIYNVLHQLIPTLRSLKQEIPRDLETVCLKALARDASDRYATCGGFAADLGRWLRDDPIHARPMGAVERFLRWCRREPKVAGLSAAVLVVFAVGFVISSVQWVRAELEAKRANDAVAQERESAQAAKNSEEHAVATATALETQREELLQATATARRREAEAERAANGEREAARDARVKEKIARMERLTAQKRLYVANIRLAHESWNAGARSQCSDLVAATGAFDDETDPREWEWFYLDSLVNSEDFRRPLVGGGFGSRLAADWSPDGTKIAVARSSGGFALFDATQGKPLAETTGDLPGGGATMASWNRSQDLLAIATDNSPSVVVWNIPSEKVIARIRVTPVSPPAGRVDQTKVDGIRSLSWSPDGSSLAIAVGGGFSRREILSIEVWSGAPLKQTRTIRVNDGEGVGLSWRGDSKALVAYGGGGATLLGISPASRTPLVTHQSGFGDDFTIAACSPDSKLVALGQRNGIVRLIDLDTAKETATHKLHEGEVTTLAWHPSELILASGGRDSRVVAWRRNTAVPWYSLSDVVAVYDQPVSRVCWSPTGDKILTANEADEISVLSGLRPSHGLSWFSLGPIYDGSWSPNGRRLLIGTVGYANLVAWDVDSARQAWTNKVESIDTVRSARWLASNEAVAVSGWIGQESKAGWMKLGPGTITPTVDDVALLRTSPDRNEALLFFAEKNGPEGTYSDVRVRRWLPDKNSFLDVTRIPCLGLDAAEWSADGRRIAAWSSNQDRIFVWDLVEKRSLASIPTSGSSHFCFAPNADRMAIASTEAGFHSCRIWEVDEGRFGPSLRGHAGGTLALDWHPTQPRLATAGADGSVRIWNTTTGDELLTLKASERALTGVAWSPNGMMLAAWGTGIVRLWDASRGYRRAGVKPD